MDQSSNTATRSHSQQSSGKTSSKLESKADIEIYQSVNAVAYDGKESTVDFQWSQEARSEVKALMNNVAIAYAQRTDRHDKADDISEVSEYQLQEHIGHIGLFHNVTGYMEVVCVGHPFLQYDVFVDNAFIKKHNVKMDGSTTIFARHSSILNDCVQNTTDFPRCGGDALKTAETVQWILFYPKSVTFIGSVGGDPDAEDIIDTLRDVTLGYKLETLDKEKTSFQFIMRKGKKWSQGYIFDKTASYLSPQFIDKPRVVHLLERASIIYICGQSCLMMDMPLKRMAYFASCRWKTLCMQLCEGVPIAGAQNSFLQFIQYMDIFFIKSKTAAMLIRLFNIPCCWKSSSRMALAIKEWMSSLSEKTSTVIVYEGIHTAYVAADSVKKKVTKYKSKFYHSKNIVDLYGCENAFSGGYISQLAQQKSVQECIDCAFFCAAAVATQHGARFPVDRLQLIMAWKKMVSVDVDD